MNFLGIRARRAWRNMISALAATFCFASVPGLAAETIAMSPDVTSFTLDNGLQVVVIPDHRAPIVTQMIWYKAGSADEPAGKSGIAHFFEHLMFKGTKNHAAGEFGAEVAAIGGSENAFTSYDYTAYYQTVAPEALGRMMELEADRMRGLVLTDEVIGPERDVIQEERRLRVDNNPKALLSEEEDATLYQNHPYRIPVIGWMHEIRKLNRIDATSFYDRYYAPNNAVLIVAGDVEPENVRELAAGTYGRIERGPALPPRVRPMEPQQDTSRTVTLRDERVTIPSFRQSWVVPSYTTSKDGEAEALDLLSEILGGGTLSRFYQELVVKRGIATSAGASYSSTALDDTSFTVYGAPRGEATVDEVQSAIEAEIRRIVTDGVSEDELEKARRRFVRSMVFAHDSASGLASIYGATLTTGGAIEDIATWPERLKAVTPDQIKAVAAKYLNPDISVSSYLLPPEPARN